MERKPPALGVFIRFGLDVCDLNRSSFEEARPAMYPHKWYGRLSDRAGRGNLPMVRDEAQTIAKHLKDRRVIRIAQARRGLDQRLKYPLQIEGRPADDLQNVGGGRLLF